MCLLLLKSSTILIYIYSYQYVGAALVSTVWLLLVQGVVVSRYRKRAGVQYPQSALFIFLLLRQRWSTHSVCWKSRGRSVQRCNDFQLRSALVNHSFYVVYKIFIFLFIGAHQNTLENIPLVFVTYVCTITSRNIDNMILLVQLLLASSSLCMLRPVVACGPSRGSLILVGMLRETPKRWASVQRISSSLF